MRETINKYTLPVVSALAILSGSMLLYQAYFSESSSIIEKERVDRCARSKGVAHFDKDNRYSGCTVDYRSNPTRAE